MSGNTQKVNDEDDLYKSNITTLNSILIGL